MQKNSILSSLVSVHEFSDYMGFGGLLNQKELEIVQSWPGVELIEQSQIYYAIGEQRNVQAWGIDRSDQLQLPLNQIYRWRDGADGSGVTVYILDTGIYTAHADFNGRATWIADCTSAFGCNVGGTGNDGNGHGTHCAGTTASATYGIAKGAQLAAVKVLSDAGSGSINGIINGIAHVNGLAGKKIISMSLGGGFSSALNNAVDASHRAGVINVVAAGNSNNNACNNSPASAELAVTVGATDIRDVRATFSSYGPCVDIFAPGVAILSTSNTGGTATYSGTSMACPHVAGAVALIHSRGTFTADQVVSTLIAESTAGLVSNPGVGSPNRLMFTTPLASQATNSTGF